MHHLNRNYRQVRLSTALIAFVLVALAPLAAATHTGTPTCGASKTSQLESGDWILVTCTGLPASTLHKITIDGKTVFEGKTDAGGNLEQSVQIPWETRGGFTKVSVAGGGHTSEMNIQIKSALDSFVETFQGLSPLMKVVVGLFITAIPIFIGIWVWRKMN